MDATVESSGLLAQVEKLFAEDQLFAAARLLRQCNESELSEHHKKILETESDFQASLKDVLEDADTDGGWAKQGESHGKYDTIIYYKVQDYKLTCRLETPIPASLLVPLMAILNEIDLYSTWIPSFRLPKLGVRSSKLLGASGRANRTLQCACDVPWPFSIREAVLNAVAIDDIDQNGNIFVRIKTVDTGFEGIVPPAEDGVVRIQFDGALLSRACPKDHPAYASSASKHPDEPLILITFKM